MGFWLLKRQNVEKLRTKTPNTSRSPRNTIAKPPVFKYLFSLWLVASALAVVMMKLDMRWGLSLLWGFSVCLLPTLCFSWYAFKYQGARLVSASVQMFYRAESMKFLLTTVLFALVFKQADKIIPMVFFLAFVAAQILAWLVSAFTLKSQSR